MKKKNTPRADGRIAVYVDLGRDPETGRRIRKPCYGRTQAEADAKADALKVKLGRGLDVNASRDTFQSWAARWLNRQEGKGVSVAYLTCCKSYATHLNVSLADFSIEKIRMSDIQDVIDRFALNNPNTKKPASRKFLIGLRAAAVGIFDFAISSRVLEHNPAAFTTLPKNAPAKVDRRALTDEEIRWVETTPHRAQVAAMLMTFAGLRRGELLALKWSDVDLTAKTITIRRTVARTAANQFTEKDGGKTAAASRIVDMPQTLCDYLKTVSKKSLYLCSKVDGTPHTPSSFRRLWESYQYDLNKRYGDFSMIDPTADTRSKFDPKHRPLPFVIDGFTPHECRHTCATLMYLAGVDALTASQQLGHSDPSLTLKIYTHLDQKFKRKNIKKLDRYLAGR